MANGGIMNIKGECLMIYDKIEFKADPFSYELCFEDRITLVGGDSASGKTVLYGMLDDLKMTEPYKSIKLFNYRTENLKESLETVSYTHLETPFPVSGNLLHAATV